MSAICHSFVQNAWKKDLCSNCFKSLSDHDTPCGRNENHNPPPVPDILPSAGYISQATTIYQSRGLLSHAAWSSLLADREKSSEIVKLNEELQSKLSNIPSDNTQDKILNGHSDCNGITNEVHQNGISHKSVNVGILKSSVSSSDMNNSENKTNRTTGKVGFQAEEAVVIGYGGNDYDSDDEFELASPDDNEFPLESLDSTDEDRAITRITLENTEFNSKNANLLETVVPAPSLEKQNKPSETSKNNTGCCGDDAKGSKNRGEEAKKVGNMSNGLPTPSTSLPHHIQRREAPPQASVKPMIRNHVPNKKEADKEAIASQTRESVQTNEGTTVEVIRESVIVFFDSAITSSPQTTTMSVRTTECDNAKPRPSFLHGTPARKLSDSEIVTMGSAIYTPSKTDLFIPNSRSPSEESPPKVSPLHVRQRSISDTDLTTCSQRVSKPDHGVSDSVLSAGSRNETANSGEKESASDRESAHAFKWPSKTPSKECVGEEKAIYYAVSNTIIHTEVHRPTTHLATTTPTTTECHYAESAVCHDSSSSEAGSNRSSPKNRESKLAALAQELEQARHGSNQKRHAPSPPKVAETSPPPNSPPATPQGEVKCGYTAIYEKHGKQPTTVSSSDKAKCATLSSVQGQKVVSHLTLDEQSKASKKGKFSIKKFLKRGKDLDHNDSALQNGSSTSSPNPKAWKQNSDFDRSKLKLEIIHPMDVTGLKEVQSTNPAVSPDGHYASASLHQVIGYPSMSPSTGADGSCSGSLTPVNDHCSIASDSTSKNSVSMNGIYDDDTTWQVFPTGGESPLQVLSSAMERLEADCSAPTMSSFSPSGSTGVCLPPAIVDISSFSPDPLHDGHRAQPVSSSKAVRPPKPPPPPRLRPFSPTNFLKIMKNQVTSVGSEGKPVPTNPKPQVPKRNTRGSSKTDYTNLGDARNPISPTKPGRSSPTGSPGLTSSHETPTNYEPIDMRQHSASLTSSDCQNVEEPPQYELYEDIYQEGSSLSQLGSQVKEEVSSSRHPVWRESDKVTLTVSSPGSGSPGPGGGGQPKCFGGDSSAWLSLEKTYAIVAGANHEVLAKLTAQVLQQKQAHLRKPEGTPLQWSDFCLQTSQPLCVVGRDKTVFHGFFNHAPKREVTLVVTRPPSCLSSHESPSKHLFLATFVDNVSSSFCAWSDETIADDTTQQVLVHVFPKSEVTSVHSFFSDKSHTIEKDFSFVFLQLIQALKILQAHGTEELDLIVEQLVLFKMENSPFGSLVLFSSDFVEGNKVTLCQYALNFILKVLRIDNTGCLSTEECHPFLSPAARKIFGTVAKVLTQEKSSSLSKVKNLLEFHLWGPREYVYNLLHGTQGIEDTLQRWLDIERAQSLRLLVKNQKNITAYAEQQHQFLIQTNAKLLKDLSSSLCFEKL